MVHHHKPPCNDEYRDAFPFPETAVTTAGENLALEEAFTVKTSTSPREASR